MSRTHHRKSLRQHLADLHGNGNQDSELHGHTHGSGHPHARHTEGAADKTPARRAHARPGAGRLLLLVCVAQLMVILDITAVNVALPQLADGLHINSSDIGWTVTSYSLIFGSLLLLGGRAADLIGRRRMFLDRPDHLHRRIGRLSPGRQLDRLVRRPRGARARRGDALARRSVDHHGHVHRRPRARPRTGCVGRGRWRRRRSRRAPRRRAHLAHRLAGDLPDQRPRRPRPRRRRPSGSFRPTPRGPNGEDSTFAARPWPRGASERSSSRSHRRPVLAGPHCRPSGSAGPASSVWSLSP